MNRNKRPRSANDETTNRSSCSHQEVLDCLLGRLLSLQDDDDDGMTQTQRFARLQQDQQLVRSLQDSLQLIQQRLDQKKARLHQRYSLLRRLDEGVRNLIFEYLDEEGFWVLEESTVMEIDPERAQEKWRQLCRQRSRPFPPLADDDRDRGIRFAKASRMARCLQELATQHYNVGGDNKPTTLLQHSWPTHACETLRTMRAEPLFFVRLVYHPPPYNNNNSQAPPPVPVVVEGFAQDSVYEIDEEPGRSEIALVLDNAAEAQRTIFESLHRLATAGFGSAEEFHEAELRAKRRIGDRLSITVLEQTPGFRLRLVVSTSGFSYEDGEYLYLQPRSPDFNNRNPSYRGNDCIRVGLELETNDEHRLGICLTG